MNTEIIIIKGLEISSFSFNLLVFMILFYMLLIIFDYIVGVLAARLKKVVSSKTNSTGTLLKGCIVGFILIITIFTTGITNIFDMSENIFLSINLIPSIFLGMFILGEVTSIIEKMSVIFADKKSGMIFNVLNYLSEKIFNLTLEKLKEKVENRIEAKADNLLK